jgi:hypothetical protein
MLWNGYSCFGMAVLALERLFYTFEWPFKRLNGGPFRSLNGVLNGSPFKVMNGHSNIWTVVRSEVWTERWTVPVQKFERSVERCPFRSLNGVLNGPFKNLNGVHSIVWTERWTVVRSEVWTRLWTTHSKTLNGQLFETFQSECRHSGKWMDNFGSE